MMIRLLGSLLSLFSLAQAFSIKNELYHKLDHLEKGRGRRKDHSCETFCPKQRAIPYVEQLDTAMTYFIQQKMWSNFTTYVSQTATMEVTRHSLIAGCLPTISDCLDPVLLYGAATQYDFVQLGEPKWQRNGVIVIRGKERVREGTEVTFEGEVYRYYMAYEGCDYKLEMILGTDLRCTGCDNCDPYSFHDFEKESTQECITFITCW